MKPGQYKVKEERETVAELLVPQIGILKFIRVYYEYKIKLKSKIKKNIKKFFHLNANMFEP